MAKRNRAGLEFETDQETKLDRSVEVRAEHESVISRMHIAVPASTALRLGTAVRLRPVTMGVQPYLDSR